MSLAGGGTRPTGRHQHGLRTVKEYINAAWNQSTSMCGCRCALAFMEESCRWAKRVAASD